MYRFFKIRTIISLILFFVTLISIGIIGFIGYYQGKKSLEKESFNKLIAVREMKANQVEDYFKQIRSQVTTFSEDIMVTEALEAFLKSFEKLDTDLPTLIKKDIEEEVRKYYRDTYLPNVIGTALPEDELSPKNLNSTLAQYLYITSNPEENGQKQRLDYAADASQYSRDHQKYHPIFRNFLEEFGYYDIFLISANTGTIVYSVFKEVDFGTSLLDGPFNETNLAEAFQNVMQSEDEDFIQIVDFAPYSPSYNAPAAFIASPIFKDGVKIGVLAFQLPIDRINDIMTNRQQWSKMGLGESGETYLVAEDYTLRNQSRFLIEEPDNYFSLIQQTDIPDNTINQIRSFNSTIGLQPVNTVGVKAALAGETGAQIFSDYRDIEVLSAYKPLEIPGLNWVVLSEIDKSEAFAFIYSFRKIIMYSFLGMIGILLLVSYLISKNFTKPIISLSESAAELAKGNLEVKIEQRGNDEISDLARSFDAMRESLKMTLGDLQGLNQSLEEKVKERTFELQKATKQVESIISIAPDAIVTVDESQNIVLINPKAEEIFEYKAEELIGKPLTILIPKQSRAVHPSKMEGFRKEKVNERQLDTRKPIAGLKKSGKVFPAEVGISKMEIEGKTFFTAFVRDISERKRKEEIILESETRFRHITTTANEGIISADEHGNVLSWNKAAEKIFGHTEEDVIGQSISLIIPEKFQKLHETGMKRVKEGGERHVIGETVELLGLHKNGHEFPIELSLSTWQIQGRSFFCGITRDISARKAMEKELNDAFETIKVQKDRMEEELNIGREIQMSMLPLIFPAFPDYNEFDIYAILKPAREVGGDFYDFFLIDEERFCFCIGDVSGKGVPAALFMAVTKTLIKSRAADDFSTASIITHVNDELSEENKASMFVTIFICILNLRTGELIHTNAGHNPPYIKRVDGSLTRLENRHGPVVGAIGGFAFKEERAILQPNDQIILYTDGVTEAMDKNDNLYSESRLVELLSKSNQEPVDLLVNSITSDVEVFEGEAEQADDITILVLQFIGERGKVPGIKLVIENKISEIDAVNERFNEFAKTNQIDQEIRRKTNIIFDELLSNTILYAYKDKEAHKIEIKVELFENRLVITIIDDGFPFNPFGVDPPDTSLPIEKRELGGFGIHFVKKMVDKFTYQRNINRNIITLIKYL